MRILVAHQVPRARTGGMSRIMGFIHDRVEQSGHEVDYLCADDVPAAWSGWFGHRVAFPMAVRAKAIAAARHGRPYDIVNVHEPAAAPMVVGRRGTGCAAVVVTSHGLERRAWNLAKDESRLGRTGPRWRTRITHPIVGVWPSDMALRRADHVFCLNAQDREALIGELGRSADSITRVYPGVDELYGHAARTRDYARASRVLFAGTWRKNKGIEDLVPAFVALAAERPHLTLHVVGGGVPQDEVCAQFPEPLRSRVVCTTPHTEEAMAAAFADADIFLLPSLFEGTPLTIMQAMMSGLPIVTTDTCGMKDVITHQGNGLLAPIRSPWAIAAAVTLLIDDRALRARVGRAARAEAVRYTWDVVAKPVIEAYEALARRSSLAVRRSQPAVELR